MGAELSGTARTSRLPVPEFFGVERLADAGVCRVASRLRAGDWP